MKYIRTKDGYIYEIQTLEYGGVLIGHFKGANDNFNLHNSLREWQLECKVPYYLNTPNGYTTCEKQADTIEELCDCYSYDTETTRDVAVARSWKLHNKEREIFGCIKTNKGLIYVAKMNEEGKLCLI